MSCCTSPSILWEVTGGVIEEGDLAAPESLLESTSILINAALCLNYLLLLGFVERLFYYVHESTQVHEIVFLGFTSGLLRWTALCGHVILPLSLTMAGTGSWHPHHIQLTVLQFVEELGVWVDRRGGGVKSTSRLPLELSVPFPNLSPQVSAQIF
jgi:hypothetical protein